MGYIVNLEDRSECEICGKKIPEGEKLCEKHKKEEDSFTPGTYDGI